MALGRYEPGGACRYLLEITNMNKESNIAYKIKTTAPKIFVVKPIQGVIPPNITAACKVQLLVTSNPDKEVIKNKFLIQSAVTDLRPTDSQLISGFWEYQKKEPSPDL